MTEMSKRICVQSVESSLLSDNVRKFRCFYSQYLSYIITEHVLLYMCVVFFVQLSKYVIVLVCKYIVHMLSHTGFALVESWGPPVYVSDGLACLITCKQPQQIRQTRYHDRPSQTFKFKNRFSGHKNMYQQAIYYEMFQLYHQQWTRYYTQSGLIRNAAKSH